jgi:hypothetical protein
MKSFARTQKKPRLITRWTFRLSEKESGEILKYAGGLYFSDISIIQIYPNFEISFSWYVP